MEAHLAALTLCRPTDSNRKYYSVTSVAVLVFFAAS